MLSKILIVLVLLAPSAWARGPQPSECETRLSSLMNHAACTPSIYFRGRCGDNVANLVREASVWGIDLRDAEVLVLQHESRMVPPVPVPFDYPLEPAPAPARGRPPQWTFHVVLSVQREGRPFILDLDYAEHPVLADEYFIGLFPKRNVDAQFQSKDRLASIYLRRVWVAEYLDTHARLGGDETALHYRQKSNLITVRALLQSLPKPH